MLKLDQLNQAPKEKSFEAPERHNDDSLKVHVDAIKKVLRDWSSEYALKKELEKIQIEGKSLDTIIMDIDLLNRAKNGRIYIWKDGDAEKEAEIWLIKNWSNLAQLIQLNVIAHSSSVQFKDFKNLLASIDGNLERFTMQWLSQVRHHIETAIKVDNLKRSMDDEAIAKSLKAMGVDVETTIRNTGSENIELRNNREMIIDVKYGSMNITSYGQSSRLTLSNGKMYYTGKSWDLEYPLNVNLVRDRDTNNSPLVVESAVNRKNIQNAISLMNLVHFTVKNFMSTEIRENLWNTENPFYIWSDKSLKIKNKNMLPDTTITHWNTLNWLLRDVREWLNVSWEVVARFLNDIYRSMYPAGKIDRGSTYVGWKKPISANP